MKQYSTISGDVKEILSTYHFTQKDWGESVVDKSKFRPTLVNNGAGQRVVGSPMTGLYDFDDGIDTGIRFGALRNISADITEIDGAKSYLESAVKAQTDLAKEKITVELEKLKSDVVKDVKISDSNIQNNQTT